MKFDKYIAHRGLHAKELWAPENSLEAFRRAVEKGIAIELDIHLTKDLQIVVFHDDNLKRLTGLDKNITEMTMSELKKLRLAGTSEKTPSLLEVLKLVNGNRITSYNVCYTKLLLLEKGLVPSSLSSASVYSAMNSRC